MIHTRFILTLALAGTALLLNAQTRQFAISTYAGGLPATPPIPALDAAIGSPQSLAADGRGNVYFTSFISDPLFRRNAVFKLDRNGLVTRVAGTTAEGFSGDFGDAIDATFRLSNLDDGRGLSGIAVVGDWVYIADSGNHRIRRIVPEQGLEDFNVISTIAGNGISGNDGDEGSARNAQLQYPSSLAGNAAAAAVYIASGDRIRAVHGLDKITTIATAEPGSALAVDVRGDAYIAGGGSVRKFSWRNSETLSGDITTIAAEDGLAMAVDRSGNIYLAQGSRIRMITPGGAITTVAGSGTCGYSGDGGPATSAQVCANGIAVDPEGNLFLADAVSQHVRKISPDGIIRTVAGNGSCCYSGDGAAAMNAQLNLGPWGGGMAIDGRGDLYFADAANQRVRKVSRTGVISTVAGNGVSNAYSGDGGLATSAQLNYPSDVAVDSRGSLYIADTGNQRVRKVSPDGTISTVVEVFGRALAVDKADNLYFEDGGGVHKIAPSGTLTTLTTTPLNSAFAATVDDAGNYYAAEIGGRSYRVRKISPDGIVTTVAGDGTAGYSGDGGPATRAQLNGPSGLAVDHSGNLYIADSFNGRIRMVSPSGVITTVAGNGSSGYSGDHGLAAGAEFGSLSGLAIDDAGNLYAADQYYNSIRLLQPVGSAPVITGAANAASNVSGAIAPGELVILNGFDLGPGQITSATPDSSGRYPDQLGGTTVQINGVSAPLVYTSAKQLAAVVPDSVAVGTAQLAVTYRDQISFTLPVPVVPFAPGIFTVGSTGRGNAATVSSNGSRNAPVGWGDTITIFATGLGQASPGSVVFYNFVVPINAVRRSSNGVTQIDVTVPYGLDCSAVVTVQVGNASSPATVNVPINICI